MRKPCCAELDSLLFTFAGARKWMEPSPKSAAGLRYQVATLAGAPQAARMTMTR